MTKWHGRDYIGVGGVPTHIRLENVIRLCELYGYRADVVEKILFLDDAYPILFPPKDENGGA